MSEDAGEVGIAKGPSRLKDTDEEGIRDNECSGTRSGKKGMDPRALLNPPNYESPVQMSCEDDLRRTRLAWYALHFSKYHLETSFFLLTTRFGHKV